MVRSRVLASACAALALLGCAETTAPLPPPTEYLLVAAPGEGALSVTILTEGPGTAVIPIGPNMPTDARPIASRSLALIAYAGGDSIAAVSLPTLRVTSRVGVGAGAGAAGGVLTGDSIAWVALAGRDAILRLDLASGAATTVAAGNFPVDIVQARGRLFVVNAHMTACPGSAGLCSEGTSWITVHDPVSGTRIGERDSIPLPGPGFARYATVGADGRIYVMSVGSVEDPLGRLSIVDPVTRAEVGSFGGFGVRPGQIAADRTERIFVSSATEGLLEFNTRIRAVTRGAGQGIPVLGSAGVAVTEGNSIFAVEPGSCTSGSRGRARQYRANLTEVGTFSLGRCAGAAATARIPTEVPAAAR